MHGKSETDEPFVPNEQQFLSLEGAAILIFVTHDRVSSDNLESDTFSLMVVLQRRDLGSSIERQYRLVD